MKHQRVCRDPYSDNPNDWVVYGDNFEFVFEGTRKQCNEYVRQRLSLAVPSEGGEDQ